MHFSHARTTWLLAVIAIPCFAHAVSVGTLSVKTQPEGVEVWVDDKYVGDTPLIDKKLNTGRYTVKLVDPVQHTSSLEEVFIQDGKSTLIEKTLKAKFGNLRVSTEPQGATVSLMTSLGKTPIANDFMNPGKYRIEIRHPSPGFEPLVEDIVINRGEAVNVSKKLERKNPLDKKAMVRLGLGGAAIVSFVWAIVEQGNHRHFETRIADPNADITKKSEWESESKSAAVKRTLGIVLGSVCVLGFEIVAFF